MRYFNTSGPNNPSQHYTIERSKQIEEGLLLVEKERYFTIWAPRQTGKSTYFRQLAIHLQKRGYEVVHINFENFKTAPLKTFLYDWTKRMKEGWGIDLAGEEDITKVFSRLMEVKDRKWVLIIDEVEGINPDYFGTFLHSIRNAYHSREHHSLKSVVLVGVTNILGVVSDNASPFNIADNLQVPYFTDDEVQCLLGQHEAETGQTFDPDVKQKISQITANQPGLVNGFAQKLFTEYPNLQHITVQEYLQVEDWYLRLAIDKNFENILNKAKEERSFVERLLFTCDKIPFAIDRPAIKLLHTNGLIKDDGEGFVTFWVPFYKKRLHNAFYPYTNGEKKYISRTIYAPEYFTENGGLLLGKIIATYKEYVKRRGFSAFREKDENGNYKSIREAALIYSFETFIHAMVQELKGKMYREANTGLGRSDLLINIGGNEMLFETKVYYSPGQFSDGKKQLAYYCRSLGLQTGVYLVFCPNNIHYPVTVKEDEDIIEGVNIQTFLVEYDEEKWD